MLLWKGLDSGFLKLPASNALQHNSFLTAFIINENFDFAGDEIAFNTQGQLLNI